MDAAQAETESPYMSIKEAARYLGISVHWLYREVARGQAADKPLPVLKIGRLLRFRRAELDAWVHSSPQD